MDIYLFAGESTLDAVQKYKMLCSGASVPAWGQGLWYRMYAIDDEYMMGDDYLFAPLTTHSDTRRVYLPRGAWVRDGKTHPMGWHNFNCGLNECLLLQKQ